MPRDVRKDQANTQIRPRMTREQTQRELEQVIRDLSCEACNDSRVLVVKLQQELAELHQRLINIPRIKTTWGILFDSAPIPTHPPPSGACDGCKSRLKMCDELERQCTDGARPYVEDMRKRHQDDQDREAEPPQEARCMRAESPDLFTWSEADLLEIDRLFHPERYPDFQKV